MKYLFGTLLVRLLLFCFKSIIHFCLHINWYTVSWYTLTTGFQGCWHATEPHDFLWLFGIENYLSFPFSLIVALLEGQLCKYASRWSILWSSTCCCFSMWQSILHFCLFPVQCKTPCTISRNNFEDYGRIQNRKCLELRKNFPSMWPTPLWLTC